MRNKTKKMRGRKTHGYGSRKKHRGKGSKGGKGMAGTGKRADQKKTFILTKIGTSYYGKHGFVPPQRMELAAINLDQVQESMHKFIAQGIAKWEGEGEMKSVRIDLSAAGYDKLLGRGSVNGKFLIKVAAASKSAREKVEKAGGRILSKGEN